MGSYDKLNCSCQYTEAGKIYKEQYSIFQYADISISSTVQDGGVPRYITLKCINESTVHRDG